VNYKETICFYQIIYFL